jgi:hypothetical protein
MLEGTVDVRSISGELALTTSHGSVLRSLAGGAVLDVGIALGNLVEDRFRKAKALGDDGLWCLCKPVI